MSNLTARMNPVDPASLTASREAGRREQERAIAEAPRYDPGAVAEWAEEMNAEFVRRFG